ncbi:MAG: DUF2024 family protein [Methylococcales bacterium]|nr:DUF2024 family protein [Methylococcales bacterium]
MPLSHVFDTYAKTSKGKILHFNVVLDEQAPEKAVHYAKEWLTSIGHSDAILTAENCYFYHTVIAPPTLRQEIDKLGYAIFKMEGCPK